MVRQDILGGLRNALERGESLEEAKNIFISTGYNAAEIEEAAKILSEKVAGKRTEIPTIISVSMEQPPAPGKEEIKPLPQIKVKATFNWLLLIPIVLISALIAFLIYNLLLS